MADKLPPIRRDWVSKSLAGFLLGAALAFGASGLFNALNVGMPLSVRGQLAMWIVPPVWLGVLGGVYFFASGTRAWMWLGTASAIVLGLLFALRLA